MIDPDTLREAAEKADEALAFADGALSGARESGEDAASEVAFVAGTVAVAAQLRALRLALVDVVDRHARAVKR
jgi:hypothetical protein